MKDSLKLFIVILLIILMSVVYFFGLPLSNVFGIYDVEPISSALKYGLDLTGGVYVVLEADEKSGKVNDETLDKAIATIRTRIDSLGVNEPTINKQGTNRVRISIPDIQDQNEALSMIGKTAKLEFVGPDKKVILTGADVKSAQLDYIENDFKVKEAVVALKFNEAGTKKFAKATKKYLDKTIAIKLDNEEISAPVVQAEIKTGEAVISGMENEAAATKLATLIKAGALPIKFEAIEVRTVGPTLGKDSLETSFTAGLIGVMLVFIFMMFAYRIGGLAADIALVVYILIYLLVMAGLKVTLTLPGIAGIILSIGMAVDANVIIFERIKEEAVLGKPTQASIDSGFSIALRTILDSNITTFIAGLVLFFLGAGTIQGFALTLMIGIVISMITAIFVTKYIIRLIVGVTKFDCKKLFGMKEEV